MEQPPATQTAFPLSQQALAALVIRLSSFRLNADDEHPGLPIISPALTCSCQVTV
jgi:hypothetical protein